METSAVKRGLHLWHPWEELFSSPRLSYLSYSLLPDLSGFPQPFEHLLSFVVKLYPSSFNFWMSPNIGMPGGGHVSPDAQGSPSPLVLKNPLP